MDIDRRLHRTTIKTSVCSYLLSVFSFTFDLIGAFILILGVDPIFVLTMSFVNTYVDTSKIDDKEMWI